MADWVTVRVVLTGKADGGLAAPPGRVLVAHVGHSFADLAEAIDTALGRWDLTPVHAFSVDGRSLYSDVAAAREGEDAEASEAVRLADVALLPGTRFRYLFDLGEGWVHDCRVETGAADPLGLLSSEPPLPVPVFGWGTLPDQYGREREDDEDALQDELRDASGADAAAEPAGDAWPDEAGEESWEQANRDAWGVVEHAVAEVDRRRDDAELARVAGTLRRRRSKRVYPWSLLWAAADLDELPEDDEDLWLALAAAVVEPRGDLPVDPEVEAAWASLEPADWAGAVIELVRGGIGQEGSPEALGELVTRCPEVEGAELTDDDVDVLEAGFAPVVDLWQALGALDEQQRLTALGRWGLPAALRHAWIGPEGPELGSLG